MSNVKTPRPLLYRQIRQGRVETYRGKACVGDVWAVLDEQLVPDEHGVDLVWRPTAHSPLGRLDSTVYDFVDWRWL